MAEAEKKCRVLIFDDENERSTEWQANLVALGAPGLDPSAPPIQEIQAHLDVLYQRRSAIDLQNDPYQYASILDDTDILIVDYDLRHLGEHRGFATGEEIAYAARLFSRVKIIVVINHPTIGLDNFDLTLQKDREFRGDLYLGHRQIANPGLWLSDPGHDGFLPWSWPILTEEPHTFDVCRQEIEAHFDDLVLQYFGLDQRDSRPSPEMLGLLGLKRDEDAKISDLLGLPAATSIRQKDLTPLLADKSRHVHVLTALLRKWFRRWVLPAQTLLADLPHLGIALPWGLTEYRNPELWNKLAKDGRFCGACDLGQLLLPTIHGAKLAHEGWTGRPAFLLQRARNLLEAEGTALQAFDVTKAPSLAFAEDLSRFIAAKEAIEYSVTLDGLPQTRAVCDPDLVQMKIRTFDPKNVVYTPQSMVL